LLEGTSSGGPSAAAAGVETKDDSAKPTAESKADLKAELKAEPSDGHPQMAAHPRE